MGIQRQWNTFCMVDIETYPQLAWHVHTPTMFYSQDCFRLGEKALADAKRIVLVHIQTVLQ